MSEKPTEESAKKWEETAKQAVALKDYNKAIEAYENACDIYMALGWKGQVGIIRQQIVKLESIKNMFSQEQRGDIDKKKLLQQQEKEADNLVTKAKNLNFEKKYDEAIACFEKAITLYETVGFSFQLKKLTWEINKIKDERANALRTEVERKSVEDQHKKSIAEEREERIQIEKERMQKLEQIRQTSIAEEKRLKDEIEADKRVRAEIELERRKQTKDVELQKWVSTAESEDEIVKKSDFDEKYKKMKELKEAQLAKTKKLADAEKMLDEAKFAVSMKEFDKARSIYKQSAQAFGELGWKDQAEMIAKEVEVITRKEEEIAEKKLKDQQNAQKKKEEIEEIIRKDQEEQKAQNEEGKGRIPQAIQRLEYALEFLTELKMDEQQIKNVKDNLERLQKLN
jgi:nucleoprotein TPR